MSAGDDYSSNATITVHALTERDRLTMVLRYLYQVFDYLVSTKGFLLLYMNSPCETI